MRGLSMLFHEHGRSARPQKTAETVPIDPSADAQEDIRGYYTANT
jgi:hypothetical protein